MTTLLYVEHANGQIKDGTLKALTAAKELGAPIHALVLGTGSKAAAEAVAKFEGIETVLNSEDGAYDHDLAETTAALIAAIAEPYDAIVAAATTTGKNTLPRVAALLDVAQVSDIIKVVSPDTFERPIYAGNAIQTVQSGAGKRVITVRTAAFKPAEPGSASAAIEAVSAAAPDALGAAYKSEEIAKSDRPELASAKFIVSGGRSLGSAEKFKELIEPLADALGGAVGASRAAVDAGYAPNDWQVGQTGKVVAPDLYVAVGISGAIQHLAGMKDSKVIVAVNKDEDAPIFQVADYGLVGDLFQVVPDLQAEIAKAKDR
ncbi:electron transfer flavoprotein subunit alpha/FixB family protein [Methylorubrum sp. Q1]|uniref:electron transfer flavoprotein subunit alpha/FixB family protein n=1 Tax=Methylorubrum sp. Q1 TaxID=2562453 RepID=UPI001075F6F5|nr:FAD-binding protein [Methylorubrum sp. Q1]TFZ60772.1 electron transfer flavoprotein subunit alpha/FixB family protein [Methylorubrum sp. Q1]